VGKAAAARALLAVIQASAWGAVLSLPRGLVWGGDTAWQEAVGRWMLVNRQVMLRDVFSWTCFGREYVNHSWAWDCVLAALNALNPWCAYALLFALPAGLVAACLYLVLRPRGEAALPLAFGFTALVAATPVWHVRPAVWGLALFCLGLVLAAEGGRSTWALPLLAAAGANVHAGSALFLPVLAVLAPFSRPGKALLGALTAAGLLLNPWGAAIWGHVVLSALVTQPALKAIPEWQPPALPSLPGLGAAACAALVLPAVKRRDPAALLAAPFLAAGCFSQRHLPFAFVLAAAVAGDGGAALVLPPRRVLLACLAVCAASAAALACQLYALAPAAAAGEPISVQAERAAGVLRARGAERPFCPPGVGDFLVGKVPVFADGRADFYSRHGGWWQKAAELSDLRRDPADLGRWGCDAAVVATGSPLDYYLAQSDEWECAMRGEAISVYIPKPRGR